MSRKKKNPIQLSVKQTSQRLGVSVRTVINYIKAREIEAIKVGRIWYINLPSVESFARRTNIDLLQSDSAIKPETAEVLKEDLNSNRPAKGIENLKCFQIASSIFAKEQFKNLSSQIEGLKVDLFANLGSGYYSFQKSNKRHYYAKSRAMAGAIVALMALDNNENRKIIEDELLPAYTSLIKKMEQE